GRLRSTRGILGRLALELRGARGLLGLGAALARFGHRGLRFGAPARRIARRSLGLAALACGIARRGLGRAALLDDRRERRPRLIEILLRRRGRALGSLPACIRFLGSLLRRREPLLGRARFGGHRRSITRRLLLRIRGTLRRGLRLGLRRLAL